MPCPMVTVLAAILLAVPAHSEPPDFIALAAAPIIFAPGDEPPVIELEQSSGAATATSASNVPTISEGTPVSLAHDQTNRYFTRDAWRWQVTGAAATDFRDSNLALGGFAVSYFLERDLTVDFELNGIYFDQDQGEDTAGINLALLFRWHWRVDEHAADDNPRWSLFLDAGFGLLFADEDIPDDGEEFNFTPQVGAGLTLLLDERSDARLVTGVRWHHVSNANIFEGNPGTDRLMLYAGLNLPF